MSNTTHLIQLSIAMDDDRIQRIVEKQASEKIIEDIRDKVEESMFTHTGWRSDETNPDKRSGYSEYVEEAFKSFLEKNREAIIEEAASKLAGSIKRSKAFKEKVTSVLEGEA